MLKHYGVNRVEIFVELITDVERVSEFWERFDAASHGEWFGSEEETRSHFGQKSNFDRLISQEFEKLNIQFSIIALNEYKEAFDEALFEIVERHETPDGFCRPAWEMTRHRHWHDVYDDGWHGGEARVHDWLHHVRGPEPQNDEEWRIVRRAFAVEIDRLRVHEFGHLQHAFDHGFNEGWSYGAFAVSEVEYRRGYQEGVEATFHRAVEEAYHGEFQSEFAAFYEREFRSWADFVRPRILDLRLSDADGDGVFEPAEEVSVRYWIANYGGVGGELEIRVSGAALASELVTVLDLPRRSRARESEPLLARVRPSIPPRSDRMVSLSVGDELLNRMVYVSYPLEIDPRFEVVEIDSLSGRAEVEIRVRNTSNRVVDGELLVGSAAAADKPRRRRT